MIPTNEIERLVVLIAEKMGIALPPSVTVKVDLWFIAGHLNAGCYADSLKVIGISSNHATRGDLIETIAHELVHVEQYALGKLKDTTMGPYWMGKDFVLENLLATQLRNQAAYEALPWEFEANARAKAFRQFVYPTIKELLEVA